MRWAFFLLLFVNSAFLIWHQMHKPSNAPVAATTTKSTGGNKSIRLLHEMENGSQNADIVEPTSTPAPRPREPAKQPVDDVSRTSSTRGPDEARTPVSPASGLESPPPLTELEKKVLAAEARQAERIDANLAARKKEERTAREHPAPVPTPDPEATTCFTLGPFKASDKAEATLAKLSEHVMAATVREQGTYSAQHWWVIEATKDERAAQKRFEELQKKKVADATIISSGEYENMISLGKYASEAQATKRVNALIKLGFRPVVEKHFDNILQYWVDVDETAQQKMTPAQLKDALSQTEGVEKQKRACK